MKTSATRKYCTSKLILFGALVAIASATGCSKSQPVESHSQPVSPVHQASVQSVATPTPQSLPVIAKAQVLPHPKPPASKRLTYRSRDYGISFDYPWQYSYVGARAISRDKTTETNAGDDDVPLTLARIEIPKGFFPDTDFESGSFTVSLNQSTDEEGCYSKLGVPTDVKVQIEPINNVPFRWAETDDGGRGSAIQQRIYTTFANDTCSQLHLLVKTSNAGGLAREIDPNWCCAASMPWPRP